MSAPLLTPTRIIYGPDGFPISSSHPLATQSSLLVGTPLALPSATNPLPVFEAPNPAELTYSFGFASQATTAGVLASLRNNAGTAKDIKVKKVGFSARATAAVSAIIAIKRSNLAPSGGASSAGNVVPHTPGGPPVGIQLQFSTAGTENASVGTVRNCMYTLPAAGGAPLVAAALYVFDFGKDDTPIILRKNSTDTLTIQAITALGAGAELDGFIEWTEV